MLIREAMESDVAAICGLSEQIFSEHHQHVPFMYAATTQPDRDEAFWLAKVTGDNDHVIVAVESEKVVGFVSAAIHKSEGVSFLVDQIYCRIGTLVVDKQHQRQGIGKALMDNIRGWAKGLRAEHIYLEVMAFNEKATAFYKSLGYDVHSHFLKTHL